MSLLYPYKLFNIDSLVLKLSKYLIPKIVLFYNFFGKKNSCLNNITFLNTYRTKKI